MSEAQHDPAGAQPVSPPPIALVQGEPYVELPQDLYIPPDALEVFLDAFEGPLDLLLYLIRRQNLDILNIPIAQITEQYMQYIALMEAVRFELAAEYLVMAAMLAEIKSRMLLPRVEENDDEESDPRAELIRRLQEYEQIKAGAETLGEMPRMERDTFQLEIKAPQIRREVPLPDISLRELLLALKDVAERARLAEHHNIIRETLSVRARMAQVLSVVRIGNGCELSTLFDPEEGRMGVVVSFLAILELSKEALIRIEQTEPFAPIFLRATTAAENADREGPTYRSEFDDEPDDARSDDDAA